MTSLTVEEAIRAADEASSVAAEYRFTVCDQLWNTTFQGEESIIEASGTEPINKAGTAIIKVTGDSGMIASFGECLDHMCGVIVETGGGRMAYYVDTHEQSYDRDGWVSTATCKSIWDILNYYTIFPVFWLPIQIQPFSHAVFVGPVVTVIETMIVECALRIQSGLLDIASLQMSGNLDVRVWFDKLLQGNANITEMLKTPLYVVRTNPFTDTSLLTAKTVRMQSCGEVIDELTRSSGVTVEVTLWLPGDLQPDAWVTLDQPTYIVRVVDRSNIVGPTGTAADSAIKTIVDLGGSLLGDAFEPLINPTGEYHPPNVNIAPALGVNFVKPYAVIELPENGQKSAIISAKVTEHTQRGWRHIVGGHSPKYINDFINSTISWIVDSISILIGIGGLSNILQNFMIDAFYAFQIVDHYQRMIDAGPYHPCVEVMHATQSAPYNVDTLFAFADALFETMPYVTAEVRFYDGNPHKLFRDVFPGGYIGVVYANRRKYVAERVVQVLWRFTRQERTVIVNVGDSKAYEPPLAKDQRLITGLMESVNVLTLAPRS